LGCGSIQALEVMGEIFVTDLIGILGKDLLLQAFTVMFAVVYISFAYYYMTRVRRRREDRETRLKNAIANGLVNGQVDGVDDLVNLYSGVTNSADDDVTYKAGVSRILRRLLVTLAADPEGTPPKRFLKTKIKELLKQIESETPFADLPTAERNLIIDARRFIQINEQGAATQKVDDLANLIEARQEAYEKLQSANKWSVPLAIIGLVLTIVFGLMSLWT
jgi:hypothetical protein